MSSHFRSFSLAWFFTVFCACTMAQTRASLPPLNHKPVVIAHRGEHVEVPENTIAAFEQAIMHGADYVEVDLRTTKDLQLVVMHDETVNRMTNGTGKVRDMTSSEIQQLSVKNIPGGRAGSYRVPTFADVINACQGKINIYLDFKDADVAVTFGMLKKAGLEKNVIVYINAESQYHQWQRVAPMIPLISSVPESVEDTDSLQSFLNAFNLSAVDGSPGQYTNEMLALLHKNGVAVWLDVQDRNENAFYWDRIVDTPIDGMQSDHPAQLIQYLIGKKLR